MPKLVSRSSLGSETSTAALVRVHKVAYTFTMKVNVREARKDFSQLLNRVEAGEEITITRKGKEIAQLVPRSQASKTLPDLSEFRAAIKLEGEPLSQTVQTIREDNRY